MRFEEMDVEAWTYDRATGSICLPQSIEGFLVFREAKFRDQVTLEHLAVEGEMSFEAVEFCRGVTLKSCAANKICFKGALFRERVVLDGVSCEDDEEISFDHASFKSDSSFDFSMLDSISFRSATFSRRASFDGSAVRSAVFDFAKCREGLSLSRTHIVHGLSLKDAKITGELSLVRAKIMNFPSWMGKQTEGVLDLSGCHVDELSLADASLYTTISLSDCYIGHLFLGAGRPTVLWSVRNGAGIDLDAQTADVFWPFARKLYEERGELSAADACFYFQQHARVKGLLRRSTVIGRPAVSILCLLGWLFAYGISLGRILLLWLITIFGFAFFYALCPSLLVVSKASPGVWTISNWVTALYFSVTSFTTLGLGDVQPASLIARLLVSVEAILGGMLMALTVVVISRKFMR